MQFGSSAFEGILCYSTPSGAAIFRLEDHLQRLINSCRVYGIDVRYSIDELAFALPRTGDEERHRVAPNTIPAMAKMAGNYLSGMLIKMEALANGVALRG